MVEATLRNAHPTLEVQRIVIATTGDKRPDLRFKEFLQGERLDKGIFTKELEIALHQQTIDIAVHSLKDVPTILDDAFQISAVLERAPIDDVLISREPYTLDSLPKGAKIGTSSVRRIRQLQWLRPDLQCVEIRGNVPTRIKKLTPPSELDAILLARAGLLRLNLLHDNHVTIDNLHYPASILPCEKFLPAAGQGAIGIESRKTDTHTNQLLSTINHQHTFARVSAERHFLHLLKAGCQTPIGVHTQLNETNLHFTAWVFNEQDPTAPPQIVQTTAPSSTPHQAAATAAAQISR